MHLKQKYIKTKNHQIIVFSELMEHKDFADWEPVSAGFININTIHHSEGNYHGTDCICYGESVSLHLKSDPEKDTKLAKKQILGHYEY